MPPIKSAASCILSGGPEPPAPPSLRDQRGAQTTLNITLMPWAFAAAIKRSVCEKSATPLDWDSMSHQRTWILAHLNPIEFRVLISELLSLLVQFNCAP